MLEGLTKARRYGSPVLRRVEFIERGINKATHEQ
jgi:hypothetical protein